MAGTLTTKMAGPLVRLWEQMPEPKWCVAMGTCTTSGGRFKRSLQRGAGRRPGHAGRRLRARLPAAAGGPDLRDDEAPGAGEAAARPLADRTSTAVRSGSRLGRRRALTAPAAAGALVRLLARPLPGRRPPRSGPMRTRSRSRCRGTSILETLRTLRDDAAVRLLLSSPMRPPSTTASAEQFEVVYHLYSDRHPAWLRVRAARRPARSAHAHRHRRCGKAPCSTSARCTT